VRVGEELVGWVDYDHDSEHDWLEPGEVNLGYYLVPAARGKGYASRAVELLLVHLGRETEHKVATLVRRLGFEERGEIEKGLFFARTL
jgi:RimJ/RimL family protein N-acetyltransferase